jgi:anti-sigma-K factor RskA
MIPVHEDQPLAAYVLGALAPDERAAVEAHLAGCAVCAQEVRSLQRVADALARSLPQRTPPPYLRERVLAAVGARPERRAVLMRPKSSWSAVKTWLPIAALLVLAIGAGAYALRLQARLDETVSAMAVLAAPDLARIDLAAQPAAPAASARALWSRQRGMVFTASNLPPLPSGRVYQVWVVTAQGPVSAGLLEPDAQGRGMRVFSTPSDIAAPVAVAVTLEPAGGVPAPTGDKVLVGTAAPSE